MSSAGKEEEKKLLPHHEQLPLCKTRLPYRQGRTLTAVKVYTVNDESCHLLVFGVPSLNLRREARELFLHFGKLIKFYVTTDHPAEEFTETYHACYDRIQSARFAKKTVDTKNFYGGSLHVCYAPELETIRETRDKLLQRRRDVSFHLNNLKKDSFKNMNQGEVNNDYEVSNSNEVLYNFDINKEDYSSRNNEIINEVSDVSYEKKKLIMSEDNIIYVNKRKKTNNNDNKTVKKSKSNEKETDSINSLEIVDCTSVDNNIVSNINEALNYNKFGDEVIKQVETKPLNKIVFNINKKKL